ncbi:unnamed protein product [Effrenium voratum]|nr:unnamed protein product [Effrenium voratum]
MVSFMLSNKAEADANYMPLSTIGENKQASDLSLGEGPLVCSPYSTDAQDFAKNGSMYHLGVIARISWTHTWLLTLVALLNLLAAAMLAFWETVRRRQLPEVEKEFERIVERDFTGSGVSAGIPMASWCQREKLIGNFNVLSNVPVKFMLQVNLNRKQHKHIQKKPLLMKMMKKMKHLVEKVKNLTEGDLLNVIGNPLMDDNLDIYQGEIKTKINEEEKMYLKERILDFEVDELNVLVSSMAVISRRFMDEFTEEGHKKGDARRRKVLEITHMLLALEKEYERRQDDILRHFVGRWQNYIANVDIQVQV